MAAVCIFWCLIFFFFNVGFKIFKNEKKIHEKMEALKAMRKNSNINHDGGKSGDEEEELEVFIS